MSGLEYVPLRLNYLRVRDGSARVPKPSAGSLDDKSARKATTTTNTFALRVIAKMVYHRHGMEGSISR
jgi:hypothetical protein